MGKLIRFVPYPVVGGFLAGTGWLLFKGGIDASSELQVHCATSAPDARVRTGPPGSRRSRSG